MDTTDQPPAAAATVAARGEVVTLRVPGDGAFLSLVRTTTAGVAARLGLTIDEIEDLRIAVDEAAAVLLADIVRGADVEVVFAFGADQLTIALSAPTADAPPPDQRGFGWTVLAALAGSVRAEQRDGTTTIVLTHARVDAAS